MTAPRYDRPVRVHNGRCQDCGHQCDGLLDSRCGECFRRWVQQLHLEAYGAAFAAYVEAALEPVLRDPQMPAEWREKVYRAVMRGPRRKVA